MPMEEKASEDDFRRETSAEEAGDCSDFNAASGARALRPGSIETAAARATKRSRGDVSAGRLALQGSDT